MTRLASTLSILWCSSCNLFLFRTLPSSPEAFLDDLRPVFAAELELVCSSPREAIEGPVEECADAGGGVSAMSGRLANVNLREAVKNYLADFENHFA